MIKTVKNKSGVIIRFDTAECRGFVQFDFAGQVSSSECFVKPAPLPVQKMPDDFDVNKEVARMKQGGCCGKASE